MSADLLSDEKEKLFIMVALIVSTSRCLAWLPFVKMEVEGGKIYPSEIVKQICRLFGLL
jgi:hypothetical protein